MLRDFKARQYILFLVVMAGLYATSRFGSKPVPDHSYFRTTGLKCHRFRYVSHIVTVQGQLPWSQSTFEPQVAQEEILSMLSDFHKGHNPPLKPKDWPYVKVVSVERVEGSSEPYQVNWEAQYEVSACKKLSPVKTELPNLTALVQKK